MFDPHPPGTKHQMMSERSKNVKDKKMKRERMKKFREKAKEESKVKEVAGDAHGKKDSSIEKKVVEKKKTKK